jgi:hypothetical protein
MPRQILPAEWREIPHPFWGEKGYILLFNDYLPNGSASDWWSLLKADWIDTGMFGF